MRRFIDNRAVYLEDIIHQQLNIQGLNVNIG